MGAAASAPGLRVAGRLNSGVRRALFASVASFSASAPDADRFGWLGNRGALVSTSLNARRAAAASSATGQAGKTGGLGLRAFAVSLARMVPQCRAGDQATEASSALAVASRAPSA